ncbi:MAG TPA: sugar ABC transporter permease [Candidatus Bathyarchaeia archaeon]|nr:sugar ABC transporter permease [Candidatus Bathyarchaeia archaeon]
MKSSRRLQDLKAFVFILPFLALYVIFTVLPIFKGIQMSFYKWTLIKQLNFVGLSNYKKMLADSQFWEALWNTTYFVMLSTPTMMLLALGLAVLANRVSRLRTFYRGVYFLPYILSVSVVSYLGMYVFQPYRGFMNGVLHLFGVQQEIFWLDTPQTAWIAVTVMTLWWTVGLNMVLYLSAMQDIPDELYEAARLDGATEKQLFWKITLPLLKPISKVILLLQIIASYKVFAQIYFMTGGGPGTATRPIIQYIYEEGFKNNNLGYATTMSYALFIILLVLSLIQLKVTRTKGGTS